MKVRPFKNWVVLFFLKMQGLMAISDPMAGWKMYIVLGRSELFSALYRHHQTVTAWEAIRDSLENFNA